MNISKTAMLKFWCILFFLSYAGTSNITAQALQSEDFEKISDNGAWCWFSDPRAIYVRNTIVGGYVDNQGSIIAFSYDPATGKREEHKLFDKLDYDDHANPSFMKLADDRIVIFFSGHGGTTNTPIYYSITKRPADITEWNELQKVSPVIEGSMGYCYSNTAMLTSENSKVYLFFRGSDFKPNYICTDDFKNWTAPRVLIKDDTTHNYVRPYMKMTNNGKDKIFFAFTDDHPRNRVTNSIYFLMYKNGTLYRADGSIAGEIKNGAVPPKHCDKVYDAGRTLEKAWIWDIAYDKEENPVLVYARFSSKTGEHTYWYARWDGKKWNNRLITKAGISFQRNNYMKSQPEYECNYSGGVYLDHENPDIVYTSRPVGDIFEIEKWQTADGGKKWATQAVTRNSERDNVRPYVIRGYKPGQPELLWMYNYKYPGFRAYDCAIRLNQKSRGYSAEMQKKAVKEVAKKVADREISIFSAKQPEDKRDWIKSTLYLGMFDWAELSGEEHYFKWLQKIFNSEGWHPGNRMYHADDFCISQTYLDMYAKYKQPSMLVPTQNRIDWIIEHPTGKKTEHAKLGGADRWSWCDALFMAPAAYTRLYALTGNKKYIRYADKEFKATYAQLYDSQEKLFFRDARYIDRKENNGQKIFWGRGNGWVVAGLVEILKSLPENDKKYRPFYERLFTEMCQKLITLQRPSGFWSASLLDPDSYPAPETSSTGLIVYALAYGVNQGLLESPACLPSIQKGWEALVSSVDTEGKLGWVQPVGADPREVTSEMNSAYGAGAFLMAACEIHRLSE